jgi:hypothetical protein
MVCAIDEKTRSENRIPLFDSSGAALYPELIAELEAIKGDRIGGSMLSRDWGNRGPWPTWLKPDQTDFTHMSRKVREVIRAAELRDELSFTSFRHFGLSETGDAELTDRKIWRRVGTTRSRCFRNMWSAPRTRSSGAPRSGAQCERNTDIFVRMSASLLVRMENWECEKCLKTLERVKGLEPWCSAWKSTNCATPSTVIPTFCSFANGWDHNRISCCQNSDWVDPASGKLIFGESLDRGCECGSCHRTRDPLIEGQSVSRRIFEFTYNAHASF